MHKRISFQDIGFIKSIIPSERIFLGNEIVDDYSHDEMPVYGKYYPEIVIEAMDAKEISKILTYACNNDITITPRGAGTGLCGGSVAIFGGIMISTKKMNKILDIDRENLTVTVEPGTTLSDLKKTLLDMGLMYPPDPGEKGASIGGNVMTNAGGMRAVKYGVTRDYVRGMEVVLPDGRILELGGKIDKNSSGYSLTDLFIGSEGTLGIVTKLILKIIPAPGFTASLLIPFPDTASCISAVPEILRYGTTPSAVEYMQKRVITAAETFSKRKFPHNTSEAYLLLSYDGTNREDVERLYEDIAGICLDRGAEDVLIADTEINLEAIWSVRDVFLEAIKSSTTEMDECDVVVPVSRMLDFITYVENVSSGSDIRILIFGHAGDGNVHVYLCRDGLSDDEWVASRNKVMDGMYGEARKLGGQVSGEHGIGHAKTAYLLESLGSHHIELLRNIKAVFDPKNIMNPGKICPV